MKYSLSVNLEEVRAHSVKELTGKLEELEKDGAKFSVIIAVAATVSDSSKDNHEDAKVRDSILSSCEIHKKPKVSRMSEETERAMDEMP